MTALVTGAHGFIGSHLVEALLAAGHDVRALVSPWGALHNLEPVRAHIDVVRADISRADADLRAAFAGADVVYHAAARVAEWGPREPFHQTNVLGTGHVVRAAERAGARRLVLVSSVAVHRYRGYRDADPRTAPRDGDLNAYARSKVQAELLAERAGLETVIVRPGAWPFGPRDAIMPHVVQKLRSGVFPIVNGGRCVLNTAYVGNLAEGLVLAGTVPEAAGKRYLIADEGAPSWREVLGELADLLGVAPSWPSVPWPLAHVAGTLAESAWRVARPRQRPPISRYAAALMRHDLHFSTRHAHDELLFRPRVSWREGLRRSVAGAP